MWFLCIFLIFISVLLLLDVFCLFFHGDEILWWNIPIQSPTTLQLGTIHNTMQVMARTLFSTSNGITIIMTVYYVIMVSRIDVVHKTIIYKAQQSLHIMIKFINSLEIIAVIKRISLQWQTLCRGDPGYDTWYEW